MSFACWLGQSPAQKPTRLNPPVFSDGYLFFLLDLGWRSAVSSLGFLPSEVMVLAVWWITSSSALLGLGFGGIVVVLPTQAVTCPAPGQLDQLFRASKTSLKLLTLHITGIEGVGLD